MVIAELERELAYQVGAADIRRAVMRQITAQTAAIRTKIERLALDAETEIIEHGLESPAARAFLEQLPAVDDLMPRTDFAEVKQG